MKNFGQNSLLVARQKLSLKELFSEKYKVCALATLKWRLHYREMKEGKWRRGRFVFEIWEISSGNPLTDRQDLPGSSLRGEGLNCLKVFPSMYHDLT